MNDYYWQCLPGATPSPTTTPTSTHPTSTPSPTSTSAPPAATGFVKTSGTRFTLNGQKYTVVGYATNTKLGDSLTFSSPLSGNSYWIGLTGLSTTAMNQAFADIAKAGGTTVRTWSVTSYS